MKKKLKIIMVTVFSIVLVLAIAHFAYMRHPKFGKAPSGERLELIKQSANYKDGKFQNLSFTPNLSEGYSMLGVAYNFLFKNFPRTQPTDTIPSVKNDLKQIPIHQNVLVWFGHSSYYIQLHGKRFLIDPVFSGNPSPVPSSHHSFLGTDIFSAEDMPEIDYLLITHDHYDHLDFETILKIKPKIKMVICGLGVGSHLEHWKFKDSIIVEKDWNQKMILDDNITLHTTAARHFSGRTFTRNNTLWLSFILETTDYKIFLGGDSGYDSHFKDIGEKFGGFDLAILENGQYNQAWRAIHLLPEEVLKATVDLNAKRLFPVHSGKFKLAFHPWDEPLKQVTKINSQSYQLPLVTPKIGEIVYLNDDSQVFERWWNGVK